MNIFSLENIRSWFSKPDTYRAVDCSGQEDVYVIKLVESLNYCKSHPNSTKCENLFLQG